MKKFSIFFPKFFLAKKLARPTICITRNLQHMLCLCCVCVVYIQWISIGFERKSSSAMYIQWIKNVFSLFKTHVARIYKIYNGYVAVSMRMYSWIILKIKLFSVFSNMFFIKRVKIPASIQQKTFLSSCKRLRIPCQQHLFFKSIRKSMNFVEMNKMYLAQISQHIHCISCRFWQHAF